MAIRRKPGNGGSSGSDDEFLPTPELKAWDGTFAPPPFNIIHEITSADEIEGIPKKDFYRTADDQKYSLYNMPKFVFSQLNTITFIEGERSYPFDPAISACIWYGVNRFIESKEYKSFSEQLTRYQHLAQNDHLEIDDIQDIEEMLVSLRHDKRDCGTGFVPKKNFKCPKYIMDKVSTLGKNMGSMSMLVQRFIMDGLREHEIQKEYRKVMCDLVDRDLYPKTARLARKLRNLLDSLVARGYRVVK